MNFPFIGGSYQGRSKELNSQRCINLYPALDTMGGKNIAALIGTPGLSLFCNTGNEAEVRNMIVMGNNLYAVVGYKVFEITKAGVHTELSGTLSKDYGYVWMAENGSQVMIVEPDAAGYIVSANTVTEIADTDFPIPACVVFNSGYFIVTEKDSGKFYISASYDGTSWDALDFATAERYSDNLLSAASLRGQLALLGSHSSEIWYNSGAADFPFENIASIKRGIYARDSVAQDENSLFFIADDKTIVKTIGYEIQPISTDSVVYALSQYEDISNAIGYVYRQEGHKFYVLSFPSDQTKSSWVYDIDLNFWHERQSFRDDVTGYWRHRSNCHAFFDGKNLVGDFENGLIYELDMNVYSDNGQAIKRVRSTQAVHEEGKTIFHRKLEIDFEGGVGLVTGQGEEPQAMMDYSDDGGHTWGNEHWRSIGNIGEYYWRAIWRRLGRSRNRVYRVTISDPVKVAIIGANIDFVIGVN